jgi:DNA polymerase-3 subunit epsilon
MLGLAEGIELRSRGAGTISLKTRPIALAPRVSEAERQAHRAFVASLGEEALWRNYLPNHAKVLPPPAPPALAEQAVIADPA